MFNNSFCRGRNVRVFEKTLIGGFSCVNTKLAFDTQILLNDKQNEKVKKEKRISSVILKMDENNQYGQAMTKPLLYGCIKRKERDIISHEDKIGHLFIVDIKFYNKNPKKITIQRNISTNI